MKKILFAAVATAVVTLAAASANATEFAGSWSLPTIQSSDPGLVVSTKTVNPTFDVTLSPSHQSQTVELFTLYTSESSLQGDDLTKSPIVLTFDFTSPTPNDGAAPISGTTSGQFQLFGIIQEGVLTWTTGTTDLYYGSDALSQAQKGLATITVNGGTFNEGVFGLDDGDRRHPASTYGVNVSATIDWIRDPAAVPEPASWALLIGGFGLTGASLRRRRTAVAAAA